MRSRLVQARVVRAAVAVSAAVPLALAAAPLAAQASQPASLSQAVALAAGAPGVVSAVPASTTPNIADGTVLAITKIGNKVFVGGTFTAVNPPAMKTGSVPRNYILAYDATTGAVDTAFVPQVDKAVEALIPGPIPNTVYVAGDFNTVNGVKSKSVALLDVNTGQMVPGFKPAPMDGIARSIVLVNGHLIVGGTFGLVNGVAHAGLVSLNPTTGAIQPYINVQLAGHHNYRGTPGQVAGAVGAKAIDVSADGTRLVVVGNFTSADGLARDQIVQIKLDSASASVDTTWATQAFTSPCIEKTYDSWIRGVKFSPDGSYFVVVGTGGNPNLNADGSKSLCDSASRWNVSDTGSNVRPAWVDYTGWDSVNSVAVTDSAVYIGGHFRYVNDSFGWNQSDDGAIARPGIAALDPSNGLPFSWNPGRNPRGDGTYAMYANADGLYTGSDTDWIGNYQYFRGKLAYFPLAGGTVLPANKTPQLPGTVYLVGRSPTGLFGQATDGHQSLSATAANIDIPNYTGGFTHGAFMLDGSMYYFGKSAEDGDTTTLHKRVFNGTTFGPEIQLDPYHDPKWDGVSTGTYVLRYHRGSPVPPVDVNVMTYYEGMAPDIFAGESEQIQGMFYSNGRLYYSLTGKPTLYYRYFTPESGAIGADRFTVPGIDLSTAHGMFLSEDTIYWASAGTGAYWPAAGTGDLMATPFNNGSPDGTKTTVAIAAGAIPLMTSWSSLGMFVM
jgi:hypothetical protein